MAITVLIADDHPMIIQGVKNSLQNTTAIDIIETVTNGEEVLNFLSRATADVILLDIDMPILNGLDCAKKVLKKHPNQKIIMFSMHQDFYVIKKAMEIGVHGYLLKTVDSSELIFALEKVNDGENYFNSDVTKALLAKNNKTTPLKNSLLVEELTKREKEIIRLISDGLSNAEISEKLFISPKTVDSHRTNIMRKLDIHNAVGLVRFAFQNGLS